MDDNKIDHQYTHVIVCPHCGDKKLSCWEWDDDGDVRDCGKCDNEYTWERNVTVTYNSFKVNNNNNS